MRIEIPDLAGTKFPVFVGHTVLSNVATASFSVRDYAQYMFVLQAVVPSTDGAQLAARFSVNGSVVTSANYTYANFVFRSGASASGGSATATLIQMSTLAAGVGSAAGEGIHGLAWLYQSPPQAGLQFQFSYTSATPTTAFDYGGGRLNTDSKIDAVAFLFDSGNLESGTITCFGLE